MTADDWDRSDHLDDLLAQATWSARKRSLFNAACARRVAAVMTDDSVRVMIDLAERRADGLVSDEEWAGTSAAVLDRRQEGYPESYQGISAMDIATGVPFGVLWGLFYQENVSITAREVVVTRVNFDYARGLSTGMDRDEWTRRVVLAENRALCGLCRCLLGNPFRPVSSAATWRTSTVVALAQGIHADRAFDRLPILADAIQDAGCDDPVVLTHCRSEGPHARGCWVLDLALGKM